jgi:D-glycero-alpha-D-manno-heptose-7-phosphate kinase
MSIFMPNRLIKKIGSQPVQASAPCRVDMGGTVDIKTFYYPLRHLTPCTFNMAIDLRTTVCLYPNSDKKVKVTSSGFKSAEFFLKDAPFNHPLGLMFAIAAYFRAEGVHMVIDSSSPPKSALGGSSAAAVALIAAFLSAGGHTQIKTFYQRRHIAQLAHLIEESVAGVPCGLQDQLAAVYGGINNWYWLATGPRAGFKKESISRKRYLKDFDRHFLLAYCGLTHESKDINGKWVSQFLAGRHRHNWTEIIACTQNFVEALNQSNFKDAVEAMNRETRIRRKMTPEVLDDMGVKLVRAAAENNCGARFTGAGGGGCIWALGEVKDIDRLKGKWESILSARRRARLLNAKVDYQGVSFD